MAELKTKPTKQSAADFINSISPDEKRQDSLALLKMFQKATGKKPVMWGSSIVGFGRYHYKSARSKQEGDWPLVSFSPRKANLTLYVMTALMRSQLGLPFSKTEKSEQALLKNLGKYKVAGGCLHINKLADVNQKVLATLIEKAYHNSKALMTQAGFEVTG